MVELLAAGDCTTPHGIQTPPKEQNNILKSLKQEYGRREIPQHEDQQHVHKVDDMLHGKFYVNTGSNLHNTT